MAVIAIAVLPIATACDSNSQYLPTPSTVTAPATPTRTSALPRVVAATPTLVPGGWGDVHPDADAIDEMAVWAAKSLDDIGHDFDDAMRGSYASTAALNRRDVNGAKAGCQDFAEPLTIELPAHLPTPDADLTDALNVVVEAAQITAAACAAVTDPLDPSDADAAVDTLGHLGADMKTAGLILKRDGQILTAAGR